MFRMPSLHQCAPAWLHVRIEAWLLRIAAAILAGRNIARSAVASRRDNNAMWEMGYELRKIADRIEDGYNKRESEA